MTKEGKRLFHTFISVIMFLFIGDQLLKQVRSAIHNWSMDRIAVGMSEAEAIRVTGEHPYETTNSVKGIVVRDPISVFDFVFRNDSWDFRTVLIETGRVVAVRKGSKSGCIVFSMDY